MKISKTKIWLQYFFKSFIWLLLPLCIWGDIKSCTNYIEAGTKLTPYSVSVSGYYRKDGTYVHPYQRRPPGGVRHDAPYESQRANMGILFFLCLIGGVGSIVVYAAMSMSEIGRRKQIIQEIEHKKHEEAKLLFVQSTLKELDFNFSELANKPFYLKKGRAKCKFCKRNISNDDFHISFVAVSNMHHVCINCLKKRESIGRGHLRSNYFEEIKYYDNYNTLLYDFKSKFMNKTNAEVFTFKDSDLKNIFDAQLFK